MNQIVQMEPASYLISYRSELGDQVIYGHTVHSHPIYWLLQAQEHPETYIILNTHPLTLDEARLCEKNLKGM